MVLAGLSDFQGLQGVAERAGYPGDAAVALMLLFESRKQESIDDQATAARMPAVELCERLLRSETAMSRSTLRRLRFITSEDVGRVAYALVKEGFLAIETGESESDFGGLFDLCST